MILPSSAKYFLSASDQDEKYANTFLRIYMDQIVDYNLGKRDTKPTYADTKAQTDAFVNLRGFSAMIMPAAPIFQSPYQTYIDAFRQSQARYAEDKLSLADEQVTPAPLTSISSIHTGRDISPSPKRYPSL